MLCPACQQSVEVDAAFCRHCGSPVGAREEASLSQEIFGPDHPTTERTGGYPGGDHPGSSDATPPPAAGGAWDMAEDAGPSRRGLAMVLGAAAVLVALALGFLVWSVLRVDDTVDARPATTVSAPSPTGTSAGEPSPAGSDVPGASPSVAPSPSPSPSPSVSRSPAGPLPAGAVACGVPGAGDTAAVYSGNRNTSCPFALEVAAAYRLVEGEPDPVEITAHSPVTGKDYTLTCTGVAPTTCVTTTGATVFLTRAE